MSETPEVPDTLDFSDTFIDAATLRHLVVYCPAQVYNLEAQGRFPRRIRFGPSRRLWSLREVTAWMQQKVDIREAKGVQHTTVKPWDRFMSKKELRPLIPYASTYLLVLETAGRFPIRVKIGDKRVAWLQSEIVKWLSEKRTERYQRVPEVRETRTT